MFNFLFYIILFFVVVLQSSILPKIELFGVFLNLSLLSLVFLSFYLKDRKRVILSALFLGALLDIFSSMPFGIFTFIFLIISSLITFLLNSFMPRDNLFILISLLFFATILYYVLFFVFVNLLSIFDATNYKISFNINTLKLAFFEYLYELLFLFLLLPLRRFL